MYDKFGQIFSGTSATGEYASHTRCDRTHSQLRATTYAGNSENEGDANRSNFAPDTELEEDESDDDAAVTSQQVSVGRRRETRGATLPSSPQGPRQRDGSSSTPKRQKSTGEKTILKLSVVHKTLADACMARQTTTKLSRSDIAIKLFEDELAETVGVADFFRFIQLLAMSQNPTTMGCGLA
ncbi:hypothetical protein PI124_g19208 [Phytophthora idaei]|nr:hypothetical protein PI126_g11621 [Phytophthora idaei]KAG3235766.1 hypothetical protein PI124_g19208 [Phytophthora idaei]